MTNETGKAKEKKRIERNRRLHIQYLTHMRHKEEQEKAFVSKYGYTKVESLKADTAGDVYDLIREKRHSLRVRKERMKAKAAKLFKK